MIKYSDELVIQRDILLARCATQRNDLSVQGRALRGKLTAFDIGLAMFERLKKNPALIAGLAVGLVVIQPRRLLIMVQTGLLTWQTVRTFTPALKNNPPFFSIPTG